MALACAVNIYLECVSVCERVCVCVCVCVRACVSVCLWLADFSGAIVAMALLLDLGSERE